MGDKDTKIAIPMIKNAKIQIYVQDEDGIRRREALARRPSYRKILNDLSAASEEFINATGLEDNVYPYSANNPPFNKFEANSGSQAHANEHFAGTGANKTFAHDLLPHKLLPYDDEYHLSPMSLTADRKCLSTPSLLNLAPNQTQFLEGAGCVDPILGGHASAAPGSLMIPRSPSSSHFRDYYSALRGASKSPLGSEFECAGSSAAAVPKPDDLYLISKASPTNLAIHSRLNTAASNLRSSLLVSPTISDKSGSLGGVASTDDLQQQQHQSIQQVQLEASQALDYMRGNPYAAAGLSPHNLIGLSPQQQAELLKHGTFIMNRTSNASSASTNNDPFLLHPTVAAAVMAQGDASGFLLSTHLGPQSQNLQLNNTAPVGALNHDIGSHHQQNLINEHHHQHQASALPLNAINGPMAGPSGGASYMIPSPHYQQLLQHQLFYQLRQQQAAVAASSLYAAAAATPNGHHHLFQQQHSLNNPYSSTPAPGHTNLTSPPTSLVSSPHHRSDGLNRNVTAGSTTEYKPILPKTVIANVSAPLPLSSSRTIFKTSPDHFMDSYNNNIEQTVNKNNQVIRTSPNTSAGYPSQYIVNNGSSVIKTTLRQSQGSINADKFKIFASRQQEKSHHGSPDRDGIPYNAATSPSSRSLKDGGGGPASDDPFSSSYNTASSPLSQTRSLSPPNTRTTNDRNTGFSYGGASSTLTLREFTQLGGESIPGSSSSTAAPNDKILLSNNPHRLDHPFNYSLLQGSNNNNNNIQTYHQSGAGGHPLVEEAARKREVRLLKNREAAKECRRKKKEYVKCLENRVAVLENQNKALIEELKSLKELYCQKRQ